MTDEDLLLQTFDEELRQSVKQSQAFLLSLDESPSKAADLHEVYRLAHSLKGASRVVGLGQIESIAHLLEGRMRDLVRREVIPSDDLIGLLMEALDGMVSAFDGFLGGDIFDEGPLLKRLEAEDETRSAPSPDGRGTRARGERGELLPERRRGPLVAPPKEAPAAGHLGTVAAEGRVIPAFEPPEGFKPDEEAVGKTAASPVHSTGKRLALVVDDSSTIRMLHRSVLVAAGFDVLPASDGLQALQVLGKNAIDLVLTDIEMPKMDGLALIRRIRQSPAGRHVAIIVVSQYGRRDDLEKGTEAGADRYVIKSQFDPARLVAMISELLD